MRPWGVAVPIHQMDLLLGFVSQMIDSQAEAQGSSVLGVNIPVRRHILLISIYFIVFLK